MQRNAVDVYSDSGSGSLAPRIGAAVYNAGKASIAGVELEATILPFDGLTLSANYAYTHGEYDQYTLTGASATGHLSCTGELVPIGEKVDLACMPFQFTPKHQYSLTGIYQWPVGDHVGEVTSSLTWAWTAKTYTSATTLPDAEPGAWLNPIGLLNASLNWERILGSSFYLQVFGTNLADKEYRMGNQNVWNTLGFTAAIYGEPRIVGARLGYRWGE
jgi:iron complex outermembrane receptor protein